MPPSARTGTGTTLTAVTTGLTLKLLSVDPFALALEAIDASNMASEDYMEKIPADLADLGELSGECEYDGSLNPLVSVGVVQTWQINVGGDGAGYYITGTGFLSSFQPSVPLNDKMTAQFGITWDGDSFSLAASV